MMQSPRNSQKPTGPRPSAVSVRRKRLLWINPLIGVLIVVVIALVGCGSTNNPVVPGAGPASTATVIPATVEVTTVTYPDLEGDTYTGTYQLSSSSTSDSLTLTINQQNEQNFSGTCNLNGSSFPISGYITNSSGDIQFSFIGTLTNTPVYNPVVFTGTAQSSGGWQGSFSGDGGNDGTWNAS